MKKIVSIITIITMLFLLLFSVNIYADTLDTLDINPDKSIVHPNENVTLNINFGQALGAYTFTVAYDNNLFEYVSSEGGTANDLGDKVKVTFYDSTGGTNPRNNMSVTFKAKAGITTSNPTDLSVTAEGLANSDATVTFDDITTPIVKNVTVEPAYVDYALNVTFAGDIIKNEEKEMKVTMLSAMGRYYDHARLIVTDLNIPSGATATMKGTDNGGVEHELLQSGWGDASGYKIGGVVNQELTFTGLFSEEGTYSFNLKLIDRDNSDQVIAEKAIHFDVKEVNTPAPTPKPEPEQNQETTTETKPEESTEVEEKLPSKLPKTGINEEMLIGSLLVFFMVGYVVINKKTRH